MFPHTRPRIALSLSGGGIKAIVFLGVLEAFEEHGVPVDLIGGVGAGGVIAGLYAYGKTTGEMIDLVNNLNARQFVDYNPFDGIEVLDHQKVYNKLRELVRDVHIEACRLPVTIVTADLESKQPVVINKGELASAILATIATPPFMRAVKRDNHLLVNGTYVVKHGAKYLRQNGADMVIGVNLEQSIPHEKLPVGLQDTIKTQHILAKTNSAYERQSDPVDVEIDNFDLNEISFRHNKAELIEMGYNKALAQIPLIKSLLI